MINKFNNPIYFWIRQNLFIENSIAKGRNDLNSYALTLSTSFAYSEQKLKTGYAYLIDQLDKEKNILPQYSIALSVALYLHESHRFHIPRNLSASKDSLIKLFEASIPLMPKLTSYYFLNKAGYHDLDQFKDYLEDKLKLFIEEKDYPNIIEVDFALQQVSDIWEGFDYRSLKLEIDKYSKLASILYDKDAEGVNDLIYIIERKAWEKISNNSIPMISLLIYEAEKLISTNLSADNLSVILNELKINSAWKPNIQSLEADNITVNLNDFTNIAYLNTGESCWILSLLEKTDRKEIYEITEREHQLLNDYVDITKNKNNFIPSDDLNRYLISSIIVLFIFLSYIYFAVISLALYYLKNPNEIKNIKFIPETFGDIFQYHPFVFIPLFIVLLYRMYLTLLNEKKFQYKNLISMIFFNAIK